MMLSRLGIRSRTYGGLAILVVLGLVLGGIGVWQLTSIDGQVAQQIRQRAHRPRRFLGA